MTPLYTILVNSTDSFEDCWQPFFTLFSKFWPSCQQQIVLNTETKSFSYPGLGITCSKVCENNPEKECPWGECLLRCLDKIHTDIILYLQDDYFLNGPVDVGQIDEFVELMLRDGVSHISLAVFSNAGPWRATKYPLLWELDQKAPYRISLQAGLWRKERLRSYVRKHENAWQFEVWGSKRAHRTKDSFFCANHDIFGDPSHAIIPYEPTGIVTGKWKREIVQDLFARHGIPVDFTRRGFHDPREPAPRKAAFFKRVMSRLRSAL